MEENKYILEVREHFPIFKQKINDYPLAYLDTAASSQVPDIVINSLTNYYSHFHANVHRGVHSLSEAATKAYEDSRVKLQHFINAKSHKECIFTKGATEAINLVATSFGEKYIHKNDEILISMMEHHSNIVPWQLLCERTGAKLNVIPMTHDGELDLTNLDSLLTEKTKIVAVVHASNSLGTINPVKDIIKKAHAKNIPVLLDGAQAAPHFQIDVQDLNCDFFTLSGHKMYGPTGIGVLYAKQKWLEKMPPYHGGGDMISQVTFEKSIYNELPFKFEAGTPAIADAIALGTTIDFLNNLDHKHLEEYKRKIFNYALEKLSQIDGLTIIGNAKHRIGVIPFVLYDIHPHDV